LRSEIYLLCFGRVLKRSLSAHLMQVKLLLVTLYLNGGLHAVSIVNKTIWTDIEYLHGSVF